MSKRHGIGRRRSEHHFTRNAMRVHRKNLLTGAGNPMRGGIRL